LFIVALGIIAGGLLIGARPTVGIASTIALVYRTTSLISWPVGGCTKEPSFWGTANVLSCASLALWIANYSSCFLFLKSTKRSSIDLEDTPFLFSRLVFICLISASDNSPNPLRLLSLLINLISESVKGVVFVLNCLNLANLLEFEGLTGATGTTDSTGTWEPQVKGLLTLLAALVNTLADSSTPLPQLGLPQAFWRVLN
jgi:hypothetical protein